MKSPRVLAIIAAAALSSTSTWSETASLDAGAITAAVDGFHDTLRRGDAKATTELLAPDAIILESGTAETREEYEKHHPAEDIAFSRVVRSTGSVIGESTASAPN